MMKVLILSESEDQSTNDVIDWLNFYGVEIIRLNFDEICHHSVINLELNRSEFSLCLEINDIQINIDEIDSYWYRRGGINLKKHQFSEVNASTPQNSMSEVVHNLRKEKEELIYLLHYAIECKVKRKIGSFFNSSLKKIEILHKASMCGLITPSSLITNTKGRIARKLYEEKIITKGIRESLRINKANYGLYSFTTEITNGDMKQIPNIFFPSLVQTNLQKDFEIRSTFFNNTFYSMAILSQQDEQTKIDFRNYNHIKPNRMIPYQIPKKIEEKMSKLFALLNLNFGSFDMVKTIDNQYVFLEINPVGQFGMVSNPMNYSLEKDIAKYLAYE